jgi:nucleotide-binding universal stress UspA family protein
MFQQILVPLDGSRLAESVLPAVHSLAHGLGARVRLLHLLEKDAPPTVHGQQHLQEPQQAVEYLDEVREKSFGGSPDVAWHVHEPGVENVAAGIVGHAEEYGTDLVVLCIHGKEILHQWLSRTVPQRVAALGTTPVLIIRPDSPMAMGVLQIRKIAVAIDNNQEHARGLSVAKDLARSFSATLELLFGVPTRAAISGHLAPIARLLPGTMQQMLDIEADQAARHLSNFLDELKQEGLEAHGQVLRGKPARLLARAAKKCHADILVLATHGKTGMDAFWAGSVTPEVLRKSRVPLLLVPAKGEGAFRAVMGIESED